MADIDGIDQKEIAQTLRDTATYIKSKNIGPVHDKLVDECLKENGIADQIATADGNALYRLFYNTYHPTPFIQFYDILEFLGKKEEREKTEPIAGKLIDRIETFQGFSGETLAVITPMITEAGNYARASRSKPGKPYNPELLC